MCTERDALLTKAYPKVQEFCQSLGLVFEVVDMRWGIRDAITVDHMTTELCLREIETCQKLSVGPTFIALIGNRYGYRPIPRVIQQEEFDVLYSNLRSDDSSTTLLKEWYWMDENAVPPVYVLQPIDTKLSHYNDKNPVNQQQHEHDVKAWKTIESQLAKLLRSAALTAANRGTLSEEQKHQYFKSVTEKEIDRGLLSARKRGVYAMIFLREIKNLDENAKDQRSSMFIDTKEDGNIDSEAQQLLSGLKMKVTSDYSKQLRIYTLEWQGDIANSKHKQYNEYLEKLCEEFVTEMKQQILNRTTNDSEHCNDLGWLLQEIIHHMTTCMKKCSVFCGRKEFLMNICQCIKQYNSSPHPPLILYGPSGTGKTAVMCKLSQEIQNIFPKETVVVLRLLGTSPSSSEIHSVLKSICFQICSALNFPPPSVSVTNFYNDLVRFFHSLLHTVSKKKKQAMILIFDSLDQLSSADGAHRLHWLPKECPPKVHIIVSTLPEEYGILKTLREAIINQENYFEVKPLSGEQGGEMIETLMASVSRTLTPFQYNVILQSFKQCGQPLLLKLAFDEATRWASYTPVSELQIATTTQEAVRQLYMRLEKQHGKILVSHALGYIVSSRYGLSEQELKDVLSLDDEVLADIYQYWAPPNKSIIHLPPLLWTRLRFDLGEYLVERQADGVTVLGLYHRQFIEVVQDRYLVAEEKSKCHFILADFFKGTWSQGAKKAITLPFLKQSFEADRKVAPQPLWFSNDIVNMRKLSEFPYHLLNSNRIDELKREVLGNMTWIVCKIQSCGSKSVIEDFQLCAETTDCPEVRLVRDALLLFKPTVDFVEGCINESLIYNEMLARLSFFEETYPSLIGELCRQCKEWCSTCPYPMIVPLCSFFQPPGGPLQTTLTGFKKGISVMEVSTDHNLLVVGSQDGTIIIWDMKEIEVIHTLTSHQDEVKCVKVIRNGSHAISGSADNTLRLWNLMTGKQIYSIAEDHSGYQYYALLHVEEKKSIIYSVSGSQINGWHLDTAVALFRIPSQNPNVRMYSVVWGPGLLLMALSEGGLLSLWDSTTGELQGQHQITGLTDAIPVCSALLKKIGAMVAGFSNGTLALVSTNGNCFTENLYAVTTFLVVSEDEILFAAGFGTLVRIFRSQSDCLKTFMPADLEHEDVVETAVISIAKGIIITGSRDETIRVWSLSKEGILLDSLEGMGAPVTALALCGGTLFSASQTAYYLKLWNLDYDQRHKTLAPFQDRSGLTAISDNGNFVYFPKTGNRRKIIVWDCSEGKMMDTLDVSSPVSCLEVANNKRLLFCGLVSGTVLAFPLDARQDTLCIPPPEMLHPVSAIGISKQDERLAVAYENCIFVFNISPGEPYPVIDGPAYQYSTAGPSVISSIAVLTDYRVLYGLTNGELCLYHCMDSKNIPLQAHGSKVTCLETSNSERHALSGCEDATQRLWNLHLCQWDHEMQYKGFFFTGVTSAAFSRDDRFLYTGSKDRSIKVWDIVKGSLLTVQYSYATITKIISTENGFLATTRLGYMIKAKFHCPDNISPEYNPIQNVSASYTVTSRNGKDSCTITTAGVNNTDEARRRKRKTNHNARPSQMCALF
ncbi:NACHT domain- and WD repeat-containing protein 1 [Protopterus annectens]|uniref:NACHT domain- and WD repeat-containing protein 1 n=1 Tax=Protopterus annectens TaxID=7888 RepID=UPI001CFB50BD|nr:NACHT domain- and WD repeat-containing protein 1 [Protopterus annectens]